MPRTLGRLKARKDFLRIAGGRRKWVAPGLILQVLASRAATDAVSSSDDTRRVGFTASKKVGNAVLRNRAKRRLRAAVQQVMAGHAASRHDYVVIARQDTPERPYPLLIADLESALKRLGVWRETADA